MKYRKKPIVIEAFRLQQSYQNWPEWAIEALACNTIVTHNMGKFCNGPDFWASIRTLEGEMRASASDYIIQGINGEIYPCKPDIFVATYEAVNE